MCLFIFVKILSVASVGNLYWTWTRWVYTIKLHRVDRMRKDWPKRTDKGGGKEWTDTCQKSLTALSMSVCLSTSLSPDFLCILVLLLLLFSHSVVYNFLWPPWTVARQAPLFMGFPYKNTGVGCPSLSRGSSWPMELTCRSCITGRFFTAEPPGKPVY